MLRHQLVFNSLLLPTSSPPIKSPMVNLHAQGMEGHHKICPLALILLSKGNTIKKVMRSSRILERYPTSFEFVALEGFMAALLLDQSNK